MTHVIVWYHKGGKQNKNQLENITDPYLASSSPLYSYKKLNEYTDIMSKKSFTAKTYYIKSCDSYDKPSVFIQIESASNTYSKDIVILNFTVNDDDQWFEIPRKTMTVSLHQGQIFCWDVVTLSRLRLPE